MGGVQYYIDRNRPSTTAYEKRLMFIGVMTTRQNLRSRVVAINRTWGKLVPGKMLFFIGEGEPYLGDLPVVVLNDVSDTTYPPQGKSFAMLKYMHDHYLDQFEWFMRADDDVFVKTYHLERFLRSVNSSRRLYVGQPGLGIKRELGKLGLWNDSCFYCLGGPGVLITGPVLRRIVSGMTSCLQNVYTAHEDTEIGRCVHQTAGMVCTSALDFSKLFHQNYVDVTGPFEKFTHALTIHPVKQPQNQYGLHRHYSFKGILQHTTKISRLEKTIADMDKRHSQTNLSNERVKQQQYSKITTENNNTYADDDVWEFIRHGQAYSITHSLVSPFEKIITRGRHIDLSAAIARLKNIQPRLNVTHLWVYSKITIGSGLEHLLYEKFLVRPYATKQRFNATEIAEESTELAVESTELAEGMTELDEGMTKKAEGMTRKAKSTTKKAEDTTENVEVSRQCGVIYMILPLYRRSIQFANFLQWVNISVSDYDNDVFLRVVIYRDRNNEYLTSQRYVFDALDNASERLHVEVFPMVGRFARARAITQGLQGVPSGGLVLAMDVDIRVTAGFLHRVYLNTKLSRQVYFPIIFTQYDPRTSCRGKPRCRGNTAEFRFGQDDGIWRSFGYGIVSVYKSDIIKVGGFNTLIKGWGKEDVDFLDKCLKNGLRIFRSADPGLLHVHHRRVCDVSLSRDQFRMCTNSREALYGSQATLTNILLNNLDI
ncbi:chondroitin sulfate synthase 1-like [Gigantopelta aegis]|uniref:chondroitin sulfate synthase 1-like n=1 Tax=Gigantopelta aegis TaxID=1735272 RepID=UPI001B88AA25|nr:chondroitin sulfate synthase 1-like [Gigantopelta aegis]